MPVGTRKTETVRRELRNCPPDGYVVLRQLSYDEMLERRDGGMRILMERGAGKDIDPNMAIQIANKWSNYFTFPRSIVDHNITDENGVLLDFSKPELVFKHLDPKIGAEIESYIDELNQELDTEVFTQQPVSYLPDGNEKQESSSDMS